jgi:hypothetical protein
MPEIVIIAAVAKNRVIGKDNRCSGTSRRTWRISRR